MLLQFSVENFRSFKTKAVLSLEASADKELPNNIAEIQKQRILRGAAVFGSNAAGKSNIFKALTAAILMVRHSNIRQIGDPLGLMVPLKSTLNVPRTPITIMSATRFLAVLCIIRATF